MPRVAVRIRPVVPTFGGRRGLRGLHGLGQDSTDSALPSPFYPPGVSPPPAQSSVQPGSAAAAMLIPGYVPYQILSGNVDATQIACSDGTTVPAPDTLSVDEALLAAGLESRDSWCAKYKANAAQAAAQTQIQLQAPQTAQAQAALVAQLQAAGFTPAQIQAVLTGKSPNPTTDWTTIAIVGALGLLGVVAASGALGR